MLDLTLVFSIFLFSFSSFYASFFFTAEMNLLHLVHGASFLV